jgi:2-dehydro-3-deoxyphosphooctonate aldolase (KDO 8-P synthase)
MSTEDIRIQNVRIAGISVGSQQPPLLIAGPCVLEDIETALSIGAFMTQAAGDYGFSYLFKASFDKANRTSIRSYRGPGMIEGLEMLSAIKEKLRSRQRQPQRSLTVYRYRPFFAGRQTSW